jgi:uncharacterized protein (TIGR02679 family)
MTDTPDSRLQRLLGTAALAHVRQRLRRHFERLHPGATVTSLHLEGLDQEAYAALCQLTGRPPRTARSMTLDVADLDARLRSVGLADSLRDALEQLEGPIIAKAFLQREQQARWSALAAKEDGEVRLLAEADVVLRRLPAAGVTRSQLAAETLGDAHALDSGRPVAALVLATWRHHERRGDDDDRTRRPEVNDDERLRDVWARAGILVNELARPALFLNLPLATGAAGTWAPGEPAYLSLRQLLRRPPTWPVAGRRVFVCENPAIVAIAAERLGAACAPLVSTDGMPAAAQRTLLDQLAAAGARLHYHGDYDWPGIAIANFVVRSWAVAPWRLSTVDYLTAVAGASAARAHELDGATVEASWDKELGPAMRQHGLAVAEEAVVETLLGDLCREQT